MFVLNSLYYGEAEIFFPPKGRRLSQSFLTYLTVLSLKKKKLGEGEGGQEENTEHLRFLVMLFTDPKFQPACTQLL